MVLVIVVFDGQGWSAPVRDATASCVAYPVVGFDRLCFFFALLHLKLVKAEPPPPHTAQLLQKGVRDGDGCAAPVGACFNTP